MTDLASAIRAINPQANYFILDENIETIEWREGTTPISKSDILAKQEELKADYLKNKYMRDREESYPSIQDQLDDIYHLGVEGWKAKIKQIKDKHPKPKDK
jgi:hypothetical protein